MRQILTAKLVSAVGQSLCAAARDHAAASQGRGSQRNKHAAGRPAEACASYRVALAIRPDYAPAHNNLGLALKARGKLHEAIACWEKAIELDPKHAPAHYNLGNDLRQQGRLDEAVAAYREAISLQPDWAEAHFNLGLAHRLKGDGAEAREHEHW